MHEDDIKPMFCRMTITEVRELQKLNEYKLALLAYIAKHPHSLPLIWQAIHPRYLRKGKQARARFLKIIGDYMDSDVIAVYQAETIWRLHSLDLRPFLDEALDHETGDLKQWHKCKLMLTYKGHQTRDGLIAYCERTQRWLDGAAKLTKSQIRARSPGWQKHKARVQRTAFQVPPRMTISCARRTKPSASPSAKAG